MVNTPIDPDALLDEGDTIADMWLGFVTKIAPGVPPDSGQYGDMKVCFHAGAISLLNRLLRQGGLSEGEEVTEADEAVLAGLDTELREFFQGVGIVRK